MMNQVAKRKLLTYVVTATLFGVVTTFQACGAGQLSQTQQASSSDSGVLIIDPGTGSMSGVSNGKTTGVTYSEQTLTALVSMTGIGTPSSRTLTTYASEKTKIAENGTADGVNAPMWLAVMNLSGEVCWDLVQAERVLAADQRRIFKSIDFGKGPALISEEAKADVVRRLARSAWARNETAEELTTVKAGLSSITPTLGTAGADTQKAMLFVCAAIMASVDAHDR